MPYFRSALCLLLVSLSPLSQAAASSTPDLIRRAQHVQLIIPEQIVAHCHARAPGLTPAVDAGYRNYRNAMEAAVKAMGAPFDLNRLYAEHPREFEENRPMMERQVQQQEAQMQRMARQVAEGIGKFEPKAYCTEFAAKMKSATREAFMANMRDYQAKVQAAMKAQSGGRASKQTGEPGWVEPGQRAR